MVSFEGPLLYKNLVQYDLFEWDILLLVIYLNL